MQQQGTSCSSRCRVLSLALASLALSAAAFGPTAPAKAQLSIGIGFGGGGPIVGVPLVQGAPPATSSDSGERVRKSRSSRSDDRHVKEARRSHSGSGAGDDDRHVKEAHKSHSDSGASGSSGSSSKGAGADETSFAK
jgi:hypothetical protein